MSFAETEEGGLGVLGAGVASHFETSLGPWTRAAEHARKRLREAQRDLDLIGTLAASGDLPDGRQVGWTLLHSVVAQKLTFDTRVHGFLAISPMVASMVATVEEVLPALTGLPRNLLDDHGPNNPRGSFDLFP